MATTTINDPVSLAVTNDDIESPDAWFERVRDTIRKLPEECMVALDLSQITEQSIKQDFFIAVYNCRSELQRRNCAMTIKVANKGEHVDTVRRLANRLPGVTLQISGR